MKRLMLLAFATLAAPAAARAQRTDNPHGDLPEACATCHRADRWAPAQIDRRFRHAPETFPLEGAHAKTGCLSCHERLDFKQAPRTCASCHEDVHRGELGAECGRCHTPRSFVDRATMGLAHENTRFPLRGAHIGAACEDCHTPARPGQLQFVNRPATCEGCHAAQARAVTVPDHQAPGFGSNCSVCHTVISWRGARFDHGFTAFPLTGAHRTVSCDGCHADQVFNGKTTQCVGCHQSDYDATTTPPHAATQFPTTCANCHTTTTWLGATFDHDGPFFPIFSGKHRGKWTACAQCHTTPSNYQAFTCLTCHEHNQTAMDNKHANRAGYRYESLACYTCHPRGD